MKHVLQKDLSVCSSNGACARLVMVSKIQWKPFWLAALLCPQNDLAGWFELKVILLSSASGIELECATG